MKWDDFVKQTTSYIGDGVYGTHDGYQIRLHTQDGNFIFLDNQTQRALKEYMDKCDKIVAQYHKEWIP